MRATIGRPRLGSAVAYLVILAAMMLEKAGQATVDTKASLMDSPGALLRSTFSLWNPQMSLGELQNQGYGYLFPMGPFFAGLQSLHVPAWVTERLWSWLVIVVACEGARLVCRQLGIGAWPAVAGGLAYGLNVRMLSEIGVRSAEVLPGAVLPWVLLPVLWVLRDRLDPRIGAVLSAAAFTFSGAVNGTATVAGLPMVLVFIVWGCRRGLARWSFLGWWSTCLALVSIWWCSSLLFLRSYAPPFFDYVEDAHTTTSTTGFDPSLRGASNWVGYLTTGSAKTWPAAWSLDYGAVLIVTSAVLVATALVGLATFRSRWRRPLALSALFGLACLTVGHTSTVWLQSPLAPSVQSLLDGALALLRNVAKVDPVLRLPLAVGLASAMGHAAERWPASVGLRSRSRAWLSAGFVVGTCLLLLVAAQPILALNLRTPGWTKVPSYWSQTADFLERQSGHNVAWVVPGSGFGIQTWGWTMDEPMSMVARTPWVTRSQVPLVPPETIRMLGSLENVLDTGSGSAQLGTMLDRLGVGFVVLRHDLDPNLNDPPPSSVVSIALARSSGIKRVRTFGSLDFGPAIEVFEVTSRDRSSRSDLSVAPDDARTVSSGPADVLAAVGSGLVGAGQAAVVSGDSGWKRSTQVVGDGYALRERQFGRVHASESGVLTPDEPRHEVRVVENYPGSPSARPVFAEYHGIDYVDASSSQAYPRSLGAIRPEDAPYSAIDGDLTTGWTTAYATRPLGQWLAVHYGQRKTFGTVRIRGDANPLGGSVLRWKVSAGGRSVQARTDPSTGVATADLRGASGRTLRVTVADVAHPASRSQVAIREIEAAGLPVERSLVIPPVKTSSPTAFLFRSTPESRACVPTLVAPDCDPDRYHPGEESTGIDREVTVDRGDTWSLTGTVVARADPATSLLLEPQGAPVTMRASSTYFSDPTVSARMAYDGTPTTSWIADPNDADPTLVVDFARPTRLTRMSVAAPARPGVAPQSATLVSGAKTREVDLGGFGSFDPLVTSHLEVTFHNPTRGAEPIGVGDLQFGSVKTAVPLDGAAPTGAICGFGPNVSVDGRVYHTRVDGLIGDVASSGPLSFSVCDGPVQMGSGRHRVRISSTSQFQPVGAVLAEPGAFALADKAERPPRALSVLQQTATSRRAVLGPGADAQLVTRGNWNRGWAATLDGKVLAPQRIDGWAQGWRLPAGRGGTLRIEYQPQRVYLIGLVGGLVVTALMLLAAALLAVRTRLRPAHDAPLRAPTRRRTRGGAAALATGGLLLAGGVLGGLPGLVGVVLARLPGGRRGLRLALAAALVVGGSLVTAIDFAVNGPSPVPDVADVLCGIGAVLALVLALGGTNGDERA